LMPLKINRFEIYDGKISYRDYHAQPKVNMYIDSLQLLATNLSNAEKEDNKLPSDLSLKGKTIGDGEVSLVCKADFLQPIPDFDANMEISNMDLKSINNFAKAYGKVDFEKGKFSLYSEMALADGKFEGYVKPIMEDVKVLDLEKEKDGFLRKVWEGIVGVTEDILKNKGKNQFATQVPLEGRVDNVDTNVWRTILNVLKNGFIKAFSKSIDQSVEFEDAARVDEVENKKDERKEKREERREKREEKKEDRG